MRIGPVEKTISEKLRHCTSTRIGRSRWGFTFSKRNCWLVQRGTYPSVVVLEKTLQHPLSKHLWAIEQIQESCLNGSSLALLSRSPPNKIPPLVLIYWFQLNTTTNDFQIKFRETIDYYSWLCLAIQLKCVQTETVHTERVTKALSCIGI